MPSTLLLRQGVADWNKEKAIIGGCKRGGRVVEMLFAENGFKKRWEVNGREWGSQGIVEQFDSVDVGE